MVTARRRPWWNYLRISVRALIVVILAVGCCLGWFVRSARNQRDAVAALGRTRSGVFYDWQRAKVGSVVGYRLDAMPPWPKWLVDGLGVDYFGHVVEVIFEGGDADLVHVPPLGRLDRLYVTNTSSVTDAGLDHLKGMTGLRRLHLPWLRVSDAALKHVEGLTALRSLGLTGTRVTGTGFQHLKGLPALEELYLGHTRVDDRGLIHVGRLTGLEVLDLSTTKITDAGLVDLKGLHNLKTLDLAGTKIGNAGLAHLKGLTSLQELNLWKTHATDVGVQELQNALPNLKIKPPAPTDVAPSNLQILDERGQAIGPNGLAIADWEGYIANPAIQFFIVPPSDAAFPAKSRAHSG